MDRHDIWFGTDGDYIAHQRLIDGRWQTVNYWLIPNTQIED
jgi:hypothetical protein